VTPLADFLAVLEETATLVLATVDNDGSPRATPLYFALDPNQVSRGNLVWSEPPVSFLFLSDPSSIHAQNLTREPRSAIALYPEEADWRRLRGVQAKGQAHEVESDTLGPALERYRLRVPAAAEVPDAVALSRLYRFRPTWIRWIDNRKGFGHHEEWTWP